MAESLSSAEANKENDTQPELSSEVECSQTLSKRISNISVQLPTLSTVAMKGDDKVTKLGAIIKLMSSYSSVGGAFYERDSECEGRRKSN